MPDFPLINPERLGRLTDVPLKRGAHSSPDAGMCALEAAAWIAGEPHSDHPECVCPVIAAFGRAWNDALSLEERNAVLRPLVPRMIGTRGSDALAHRRALMAADWLVREHTPAWLRLAGLTAHADALAGLAEITAMDQVQALRPAIEAARQQQLHHRCVSAKRRLCIVRKTGECEKEHLCLQTTSNLTHFK